MNVKKCILSVFSLLMLALSGCGGHSEYYENGYERGYGMGSKEVEIIAEAMGVTDLSNIDKSIFDPDKSYSVWMERTIPSDDEYVQSEFKKGFIDGYTQGVNDAIDGGNGTSSNNSSSSDSYATSDSGSDLGKYVGKWEGQVNPSQRVVLTIKKDGAYRLTIYQSNERYDAIYSGEVVEVSDDVIKLPSDSYMREFNSNRMANDPVTAFVNVNTSFFLRSDGALSKSESDLNNPYVYLQKN